MPTTPELKAVWLRTFEGNQLRLDWTNDRHHSADLPTLYPLDVVRALQELAWRIEQDVRRGDL